MRIVLHIGKAVGSFISQVSLRPTCTVCCSWEQFSVSTVQALDLRSGYAVVLQAKGAVVKCYYACNGVNTTTHTYLISPQRDLSKTSSSYLHQLDPHCTVSLIVFIGGSTAMQAGRREGKECGTQRRWSPTNSCHDLFVHFSSIQRSTEWHYGTTNFQERLNPLH